MTSDRFIVIVGCGRLGSHLANQLSRAGASVVILERMAAGGGSTARSHGIVYLGGGTPVQAACGFADTPEAMYAYLLAAAITLVPAGRLAGLQKGLDQEITRLAATKGFAFAQAVLSKLLEPAPTGMVEPNVTSLDGFKVRILQQGAADADLQMAKKDYEKARESLKRLDDGPEDVFERTFFASGWKKKFALFKRDVVNAMNKLNETTLQLAAQQQATGIYDQLASLAGSLKARLASAANAVSIATAELQITAERLSSPAEAQANGYEFLQEIEVDFADYYWEHATRIDPKAVFQSMIPARVIGSMDVLAQWTAEEIKPAAVEYARQFFVDDLNATSLLSTLKSMAEKRGLAPQMLIGQYLDHLVEYCHPFWVYDKDHGLSDLEGKSILGVEDENSPLIPPEYRNGSLYEIKTTGFRDRIDVVRVQHGLPAFRSRGMDEDRGIYEQKRKGTDPLHVLPGMEFARDLMPEQGRRGRDLFAIALAFGHIVQVGSWYYFDPERGYATHKIQPAREFRLAQGREKSEEVFSHRDEWLRQVDQAVEGEVRSMGNDAAIAKLDKVIEAHKAAIARMPATDESLRKQYEKEINAFKAMQRRLGKVG